MDQQNNEQVLELKSQAIDQCSELGHEMSAWCEYGYNYIAVCSNCGCQVSLSAIPTENSSSISGRAVNKLCPQKPK